MRVFIGFALLFVLILAGVLIYRGLNFGIKPADVAKAQPIDVDAAAAAENLGAAIRIRTISHTDRDRIDYAPFLALHEHLAQTYPRVHETLARETVSDYSLLYRWEGRDPALDPVILMGHMDVVPVEGGTDNDWDQPPFSGAVADGFIWGRGALDDKITVVGLMEAAEALIATGFAPERTLYFAFGHDEEIGGRDGAVEISALLESRGVEPAFILDEGMVITKGVINAVSKERPVALIALAEKGYVSLELTARAESGHSARPPHRTAVGALAKAIAALEANQFEPAITPPVRAMFRYLGPHLDFKTRLMFANEWLAGGLVADEMAKSTPLAPLVRTTTAPTILEAGVKDNVLPTKARAVVNFRIRPGQTVEDVIAHVERVVGDPDVTIEPYRDANIINPSPVASVDGHGFRTIYKSVRQIFPDAVVTPSITLGATDSRHYKTLTDEIYRFVPNIMTREDLSRVHGKNERVAVDNFADAVRFYAQLMRNAAGKDGN